MLNHRKLITSLYTCLTFLVLPWVSIAIADETLQFSDSPIHPIVREGHLKGRETIVYSLYIRAGQILTVSLAATNGQNYFNINPPDSETSMFIGNSLDRYFTGFIPTDGFYKVQLYLMRAAARRNESSRYTLRFELKGEPMVALSPDLDRLIPESPFHASALINCAQGRSVNKMQCEAYVIRRGHDGTATVEIRRTEKESAAAGHRRILFSKGKPLSSDAPDTIQHTRRGDTTLVRIGADEYYEIPDALIYGG